ncbi:MAG: DUF2974 domain-containing protein [Ruminococcus sp.]|nr:DUF2974 domain-containing protein [Ruminococcus sp.]
MDWRGDVPFSVSPFNEVDALILCQFAYVKFERVASDSFTNTIAVADAYKNFKIGAVPENDRAVTFAQDNILFCKMAESRRFGNMLISGSCNMFSQDENMQFAAITCMLDDGSVFIAFRGTDGTMVGWKEDFMMSYVQEIPSQRQAVSYLNENFKGIKCPIRIGGHSKGGNLAVYASMFIDKEIQDKLTEVYSFDGPGFRDEIVDSESYKAVQGKIHSFVPEGTVVSMLLNSDIQHKYVRNSVSGLMQHVSFNWMVERDRFDYLPQSEQKTGRINKTLSGLISDLDDKEREGFVNALFKALENSDASTIYELKDLKKYPAFIKAFSKLEPDEQSVMKDVLKKAIKNGKNSLFFDK